MDTNELIIEEQQKLPKEKNKKTFVFSLFALVICLVSGIYIYASNPVQQIQQHLDKRDYENAVIVYNDKIHGGQMKIHSILSLWSTSQLLPTYGWQKK